MTAATQAQSPAHDLTPVQRALIMVPMCLGASLFILNQTNIVVSLPHMQGTFSATRDQIAWVLTSYIVAMTIAVVATGWFSGRFGRKNVFVWALVGFTVMSFFCGAATSLEEEVTYRMIMGLFAGPIMPLSQAIVLDTFPKEKHGSALGIWGLGITVAPVAGPWIGGVLTEEFSWPWVFYFNIPLGVILVFFAAVFVPKVERNPKRHFDWGGFVALAVAVTMLQFILNRGQRLDWFDSLEIVISFAVMAAAIYFFLVHSFTTARPFLEPAMFRDRNVIIGFVFIFCWALVVNSPVVLLALRLQNIDDYPVETIGWLLMPRGLGGMFAMLIVGRVMRAIDPKHVVCAGFLMIAAGCWIMSGWSLSADVTEIWIAGVVYGMGIALVYVPVTTFAFATIDPRYRTDVSAVYSLMLNMGSGIGITIAIIVLTQAVQVSHEDLSQHVSRFNELFRAPGIAESWGLGSERGLQRIENQIQLQATAIAYNNTFWLLTLWAIAISPLIYLIARRRRD
ncbi:MAG: DHA2 family efflux MFS transporter permease subunit [Rhodospirillaceae bacterium]|jgi:MFS transporter, DHA2 family, multidrug resistance protein|nr:DHA2 family efflux MFS transporter permease subunit [Rhodospirillaceae bacterium]MBT6116938.1 DHA2 family efflux MFS transporter permease subunit [Rhodospirillaceae bacterium]